MYYVCMYVYYYIADNSCPENKHCLCNIPVPELTTPDNSYLSPISFAFGRFQ